MSANIEALERLIERGQDSAMLRLTLGTAMQEKGDTEAALTHLRRALDLDPEYSAAWKALGHVYREAGHVGEAKETWEHGLTVAEAKGDMQVVRELQVYLRKLDKEG
ncbi:tetratricopeptide repeat protein [Marinobacteraceae bacterium S3BR75-40.1]